MPMNGKGLSQQPSPVKIFIVSYMVLIAVGLLLSLWMAMNSPVLKGVDDPVKQMEEAGMGKEDIAIVKAAKFYADLKLAHVHHLGHIFMVFSVAGIYAFTSGKDKLKIQIIVWTAIVTLINTLGLIISSRVILIMFGGAYGALMAYMLVVSIIECCKPVRE